MKRAKVVACARCAWRGSPKDLNPLDSRERARLKPGATVPAGKCKGGPKGDCRGLAYLIVGRKPLGELPEGEAKRRLTEALASLWALEGKERASFHPRDPSLPALVGLIRDTLREIEKKGAL